ncbi:MAG: hypothetical protein H7061_06710 [Bdellovibrionaceae bacterium]|nr:hypothetical protein [Bdellovibrio sp.]
MKNLKTTLFLSVVTFTSISIADEIFKSFAPERFDSYFSVNYFKTEANYSAQGSQTSLASGASFQITDINAKARYIPSLDFGIYGAINIGSSESADAIATRRNSTLNELTLGVDYQIYTSEFITSYVDGALIKTLEKIKPDTDSALNNDGADKLIAQITAIFDLDGFYPFAQGGFNYRTEGLSTLMTYAGGLEIRFIKATVGAGLYGYITIKDDSKTNKASERDAVNLRVDAGSKKFNGVNPNNLDSDFYVKFDINRDISIKLNVGTTLLGSNSASGSHFGGTLAWGFGGSQRALSRPRSRPVKIEKQTQPAQQFKEDTDDGVNQDYFKTVRPSKDNYIKQLDGSSQPAKSVEPAPPGYKLKLKKLKKK